MIYNFPKSSSSSPPLSVAVPLDPFLVRGSPIDTALHETNVGRRTILVKVGIGHGFPEGFLVFLWDYESRLLGLFPGLFLALGRRLPQAPQQGKGTRLLLLVHARKFVVFFVLVVFLLFPEECLGTIGPDVLGCLVQIEQLGGIFPGRRGTFVVAVIAFAGAFLGLGGNRKGPRALDYLDLSFRLFRLVYFVLLRGFRFLRHGRRRMNE